MTRPITADGPRLPSREPRLNQTAMGAAVAVVVLIILGLVFYGVMRNLQASNAATQQSIAAAQASARAAQQAASQANTATTDAIIAGANAETLAARARAQGAGGPAANAPGALDPATNSQPAAPSPAVNPNAGTT